MVDMDLGQAVVHAQPAVVAHRSRQGADVHLELPVTLAEALLGAEIRVPTVQGKVSMKIPPGSNSGTVLRLKGRGIMAPKGGRRGDQYVKLRITLPDRIDDELAAFLRSWEPPADYDPRRKLKLD